METCYTTTTKRVYTNSSSRSICSAATAKLGEVFLCMILIFKERVENNTNVSFYGIEKVTRLERSNRILYIVFPINNLTTNV